MTDPHHRDETPISFDELIKGKNTSPASPKQIYDLVTQNVRGGMTRENTINYLLEKNGHNVEPYIVHAACTI